MHQLVYHVWFFIYFEKRYDRSTNVDNRRGMHMCLLESLNDATRLLLLPNTLQAWTPGRISIFKAKSASVVGNISWNNLVIPFDVAEESVEVVNVGQGDIDFCFCMPYPLIWIIFFGQGTQVNLGGWTVRLWFSGSCDGPTDGAAVSRCPRNTGIGETRAELQLQACEPSAVRYPISCCSIIFYSCIVFSCIVLLLSYRFFFLTHFCVVKLSSSFVQLHFDILDTLIKVWRIMSGPIICIVRSCILSLKSPFSILDCICCRKGSRYSWIGLGTLSLGISLAVVFSVRTSVLFASFISSYWLCLNLVFELFSVL